MTQGDPTNFKPKAHCCDHPTHYQAAKPMSVEQFLEHWDGSLYTPLLSASLLADICRRIVAIEEQLK